MTTNSTNINSSGLPIFNSTTGQFSAVSLTTKGDALAHTGAAYTRVAVGNDYQYLQSDSTASGGVSWADVPFTGDMVFIARSEVTDAATVDFTDLDNSTYQTFFIFIQNVHPQTDNVNLQFLYSTNNGSSFLSSNYQYVYNRIDSGSGTDTSSNSTSASSIQMADEIGNSNGEGVAGWIWFFPNPSPTQIASITEWQLYGNDVSNDTNGYWGGGINTTTSAIDAIRIKFSSGNIEVGNFYLYGLSSS